MKRCLLFIPRMGGGGAERVMATIANNLCTEHEVILVSMTDAESFYALDERVKVVALGQRINRNNNLTKLLTSAFGGTIALLKLRKLINKWKPDAMLSFLTEANLISILLKIFGVKCRVVISERNDPTTRGKLTRWFERNFYPKADAVVCQSVAVVDFFKEEYRHKMTVIPNPIAASAIPARFDGKRQHKIVGVGRLDSQKNFQMLVRAFATLTEKFSDYKLEIYGGGPLENELQNLINSLGLQEKAKLMGVQKNVMHYISDAALFVMSSNYEGFPNALAEAMATGIPVISTNFSTGVAKDIVKEENGLVIPVGDEKALVAAMEQILSSEEKWEMMSLENRNLLYTLSEEAVIAMWKAVLNLD